MAEDEISKTEQGRLNRVKEKEARAFATQSRRDGTKAAQSRVDSRVGANREDNGTAERMSAREAAAGLTLAGNDTMSGRGGSGPSFSEREAANGLTNTMSGRAASRAVNPDFPQIGTPVGNDFFESTNNVGGGGGGSEANYAFKVVNDGDGTVSVTVGTVNTSTATALTPSGKPTALWLDVTFDATSSDVTAAVVATSSGSTSATKDYRQIATITWDGDTPTIVQGIKGSQSIASCGSTHQWGTLYS